MKNLIQAAFVITLLSFSNYVFANETAQFDGDLNKAIEVAQKCVTEQNMNIQKYPKSKGTLPSSTILNIMDNHIGQIVGYKYSVISLYDQLGVPYEQKELPRLASSLPLPKIPFLSQNDIIKDLVKLSKLMNKCVDMTQILVTKMYYSDVCEKDKKNLKTLITITKKTMEKALDNRTKMQIYLSSI